MLISLDADFDQKLKELTHHLKASLFLDAIGGEFTQRLLDASPNGSLLLLYSNLSRTKVKINPRSLWYFDRRVEGFHLSTWNKKQNLLKLLINARRVQDLSNDDLAIEYQKRILFTAAQEGFDLYLNNMTAGKVLLVIDPHEVPLS